MDFMVKFPLTISEANIENMVNDIIEDNCDFDIAYERMQYAYDCGVQPIIMQKVYDSIYEEVRKVVAERVIQSLTPCP